MQTKIHSLRLKRLGISTYKEAVVYIRDDSYICKSEGFEAQSRIHITFGDKSIIATLNTVTSDLLQKNEASLSDVAWEYLQVKEGDTINLSHPSPLGSMMYIRGKIFGKEFDQHAIEEIIKDIANGNLSDIQIAAFISSCAGNNLSLNEIVLLTKAMLEVGDRIEWGSNLVVDKHCIGGLPGNRTTMIIVPIVAAFGLTIPKTSSHAITSSAGTADTMETLAPVDLSYNQLRKVVERENGCIAWGGSAALSPADEVLIRVERVLNLDSLGQVVASVLSKKLAAGSNRVLIDIPVGPTSKVRTDSEKDQLAKSLEYVGDALGIGVRVVTTDGSRPVGYGIGPALEAYDVLDVLQNKINAPQDLRERALMLAGKVLEFSPKVKLGEGREIAKEILTSGKAWQKFQAICEAQGGMRTPPIAKHTYVFQAPRAGRVAVIDNRRIAKLAKLAGAPRSKAAGVFLNANVDTLVERGQPLLTVHAESPGELDYALSYLLSDGSIIELAD